MTKPTKSSSGGSKKPAAGKGPTGNAPAKKVQSRKIVNQRQTPWGLIITTVVIVALAVGIIGYAVSRNGGKSSTASGTAAADKIVGIQHFTGLTRNHVNGVISYKQSPPVGGDHSPVWADCSGTIYPAQIANENAVHTLEHGAVWIAYKPGLPAAQIDVLTKLVAGNQFIWMEPYAGLTSNVSLQAWGYQLAVDSASDPRVAQFITDLKLNQSNTPEFGASCDNANFKSKPSTPGHPVDS
jgi:hypothetical protein